MNTEIYPLNSDSAGTRREIVVQRFGISGTGPKVFIQASLHADELPGMLVGQHLRQRFAALEAARQLTGEIVLVPVANPIGLSQSVLGLGHGRFDLRNGKNFNRHFPALAERVIAAVDGQLTGEPRHNACKIRDAIKQALADEPAVDELTSQRLTLMRLAADADIVLDLHCDCESIMHLYVATPLWSRAEPLARLLGARVALLATESGDDPFDEACSRIWWELAAHFGPATPVPLACFSATIELRGLTDVRHDLALADATAIEEFLRIEGVVRGVWPELPASRCQPTPLAGSVPVLTPAAGLVVFVRELGETLVAGETLAELIDPISGAVRPMIAPVTGIFFARDNRRYVGAGASIAKVAGRDPVRTGRLLSP